MSEVASKRPFVDNVAATYDKKNKKVNYVLKFSSKCSCGSYKHTVTAAYNSLMNDEDPAITMMKKTIGIIERHEQKSIDDGSVKCDLDLSQFHVVMRNNLLWRGAWANIKEQVRLEEEAKQKRSEVQKKQHADKATAAAEKPWEEGEEYNVKTKHLALSDTMKTIQHKTGKSITRVKELLTSVASKLNNSIDDFDCEIIFDKRKRQKTMEVMFDRAKTCIKSLTSSSNTNAQLLTGVAALFLPKPDENNKQEESK